MKKHNVPQNEDQPHNQVVLIDNYDSFTYNVYQSLVGAGHDVHVVRNDVVDVATLKAWQPSRLIISPGPGVPADAGVSVEAIQAFAGKIPVLGICLGHQALAEAFGGHVVRAKRLMHGKTSEIHHDDSGVFAGMPNPFVATRYHSLIVDKDSLPKDFRLTAWTQEGEIMGLRHIPSGAEGVQFHPESILTEEGDTLLDTFAK